VQPLAIRYAENNPEEVVRIRQWLVDAYSGPRISDQAIS